MPYKLRAGKRDGNKSLGGNASWPECRVLEQGVGDLEEAGVGRGWGAKACMNEHS